MMIWWFSHKTFQSTNISWNVDLVFTFLRRRQVGVIVKVNLLDLLFWEILLSMQRSPLVDKSCVYSMPFYPPTLWWWWWLHRDDDGVDYTMNSNLHCTAEQYSLSELSNTHYTMCKHTHAICNVYTHYTFARFKSNLWNFQTQVPMPDYVTTSNLPWLTSNRRASAA